jgi:surface antigen
LSLRWLSIALGGWGFLVLLCVPAAARTSHEPDGGNCVAYAREVTGVRLDGNAASWWPHAEGHYDRGHQPTVGAILVFRPYARMHVGHVAVVSQIVGPREVLVDQANWVRGRVTRAMSVIDASPLNDWTSVKVMEPHSGKHGRENPTYGFIYPRVLSASFGETIIEPQRDRRHADAVAARAKRRDAAKEDRVARADPATAPIGETVVEPRHDRRHADRTTERAKRRDTTQVERVALADPRPVSSSERIVEPQHDRKFAAHAKHQKDAPEKADAARTASAKPQRDADAAPHHKRKAPDGKLDAKLAYVY